MYPPSETLSQRIGPLTAPAAYWIENCFCVWTADEPGSYKCPLAAPHEEVPHDVDAIHCARVSVCVCVCLSFKADRFTHEIGGAGVNLEREVLL